MEACKEPRKDHFIGEGAEPFIGTRIPIVSYDNFRPVSGDMSAIFISYASSDRERVKPIAEHLRAQGWSVWWDVQTLPGQSYDQIIDSALRNALCVVVLWSTTSVKSQWVISEADYGRKRGILVPALLDNIGPPRPFDRIQTADLTRFSSPPSVPEIERMVKGISEILSSGSSPLYNATPVSHIISAPNGGQSENGWSSTKKAILTLAITALFGLAAFLLSQYLERLNRLHDLQSKQEQLLIQMGGVKTLGVDDLLRFYASARDLASSAGRYNGDKRSNTNKADIARAYSHLWIEASREIEAKAGTEIGGATKQQLAGEAKRLIQIPTLDGVQDTAELRRLNHIVAVLEKPFPPFSSKTSQQRSTKYEVKVLFYIGAKEPTFTVDDKSVSPPPYSMGIATFKLGVGSHRVRADYAGRICSATVIVPQEGLVASNCELR